MFTAVSQVLLEHTKGDADEVGPLYACCQLAARLGARMAVVQERVLDPDFLAEFNAYFSKQFADCGRYCVRIHFFRIDFDPAAGVLKFLDQRNLSRDYLGFITLRPISRTPVGATFLKPPDDGAIRCLDRFPVHLGGVELSITGTPFLQQDNAVGACAQASIWMALRTMRKREGDRAFDPAQISGAATRYSVASRILPNRSGLTWPQMLDAVRGAGYSPHQLSFATNAAGVQLATIDLKKAKRKIVTYLDSEIPVLLLLNRPKAPASHAVVAIGYRFADEPKLVDQEDQSLERGVAVSIEHAAGWASELLIHNDMSGPYLPLPDVAAGASSLYALEQTYSAIPLLPADVFLTGEEAMEIALHHWLSCLQDITQSIPDNDVRAFSQRFVVRLLLLEKRRLRAWATNSGLVAEVSHRLRMADLPRRVWALEIHDKARYADHAKHEAVSLVGFVLLDPTGDDRSNTMLMSYLNLPIFSDLTEGVLLVSQDWQTILTAASEMLPPFWSIGRHAEPIDVPAP